MEIQSADPRLRKLAIVVAALIMLLGAAALFALQATFADAQQSYGSDVAGWRAWLSTVFAWSLGTFTLLMLLVVVYFWRMGRRVRNALQFPPPGVRVIRDMVILRGNPAVRRGWLLQVLAAALALSVAGLLVAAWRVYALFGAYAGPLVL